MEKEALLNIISNDLKEVELLISTFKQMGSIDSEFLHLTLNKLSNLTLEVKMLEKFSGQQITSIATPIVEKEAPKQPIIEEVKTPEVKIEDKHEPLIVVEEPIAEVIIEQKASTPTKKEELLDLAPEEIVTPENKAEVVPIEPIQPKEKIVEAIKERPIVVETVVEEKIPVEKNSAPKEEKAILKDVLATNKKSVNETISTTKATSPALGQNIVVPIANIYKAIGINDKMLFQRELFENNGAKMNSTIDQLNELTSIEEATGFLKSNYRWDFESETVVSFINIIKRRYL